MVVAFDDVTKLVFSSHGKIKKNMKKKSKSWFVFK